MAKLKALLLTEGMHGMISQVEGMAKALKVEYYHKIVGLNFPWTIIPASVTPVSKIVLKDKSYLINNEVPDLIISCGRKSVIASILFKKKNPKIFTIHIQDPKVNSNNFDIIISPEHDNLKGNNVINSKGAIHYITELEINNGKGYLANIVKNQKVVSLILGGPNKYYKFSNDQLVKIFDKIKSNFTARGYFILVIPSMRTPQKIINLAIAEFKSDAHVISSIDKKAYLSSLSLADNIIVTCDSTSMISEATMSGKPIFVAHMKPKRNNYRFKRFFKLFKDMGIIRDLGDKIESWKYIKLNEAERIAAQINKQMKN